MNYNCSLMNFLIYEYMRKIFFFFFISYYYIFYEDYVRKEPRKRKVFFNRKTLLAPE